MLDPMRIIFSRYRVAPFFIALVGFFVSLSGAFLFQVSSVEAATCTYADTGDHDFNSAANWDCGHVPTSISSDVVIINAGDTATMTADAQFTTLADLSGTLALDSYGLIIDNTALINSGGILNIQTGTVTSTEDLTVASGGAINGGTGDLILGSDLSSAVGDFHAGSGTVHYRGTMASNDRSLPSVIFHNLNIEVDDSSGIFSWATTSTVLGNMTIGESTNFTNLGVPARLTILGNLNNNGLFNPFNSYVTTTGNINSPGSFFVGGGEVALAGNLITTPMSLFNGGFGSGTFKLIGGSTQSLSGQVYNNFTIAKDSGNVGFSASTTIRGTFNAIGSGSTLDMLTSDLTVVGATRLEGSNNVASITGTLLFESTVDLIGGSLNNSVGNTTILDDLMVNTGGIGIGSGTLTLMGNATTTGYSSVNFGAGTWAVYGDLDFDNAYVTRGSGTLRFMGGADQDIRPTTNLIDYSFNNVQSLKSGGTVNFSNTANTTTIIGYFTSSSTAPTTFDFGAMDITVGGNASFNENTTIQNSGAYFNVVGTASSTGTISSANAHFSFGALQNNGLVSIGSGVVTTTGHLMTASTGSLVVGNGTVAVGGNFSNAGMFTPGTGTLLIYDPTGIPQSISLGSSVAYNVTVMKTVGGTATFASTTVMGDFLMNGASPAASSFGSNDLVVVGGTTLTLGTVTSTSGNLTFRGAATSTGSIGSNSGNLLFGSTMQNNGTFQVGAGSSTVVGTLTNAASGTVDANSGTLNFGSSFSNAGSFNKGSSTIRYLSNTTANIAPVEYNALTLGGTGTYSLTASTTVSGATSIGAGATLAVGGNTLNVPGAFSNSGLMTTTTGGVVVHPVELVLFTNGSGTLLPSASSGDSIYITVEDHARNFDGTTQETMVVPLTTNSGAGSDSESVTLTETTASSGIFRNASGFSVRSASVGTSNGFIDLTGSGLGTTTYTDTGDATSTTITLTYVAPPSGGGGGGGGGSAGGGGGIGGLGYFLPGTAVIATTTPPVSQPVPVPMPTPSPVPDPSLVPTPTPAPAPSFLPDLTNRDALLAALGVMRDTSAETRALSGVRSDAREFGVMISDAQANRLALFIAYGLSSETRRLGEGERRALIRDMLETMQRADLNAEDMQRLTVGQIPLMRNLNVERQQLPRVRQTFRTLYGHDPNFQNVEENLAWNTLMYRIRFRRDLVLEQQGIREFRSIFGRSPSSPFQWAAVRVQGYVQR